MKTEVKNDNELIAEFMGGHKYGSDSTGICWEFDSGFNCDDEDLKYHKSWSWLMPVVEKIEHDGHEIDIYKNACEIDMEEGMIREVAGSKIEATHKAVVEFIRWYNSQTTSNPEQQYENRMDKR